MEERAARPDYTQKRRRVRGMASKMGSASKLQVGKEARAGWHVGWRSTGDAGGIPKRDVHMPECLEARRCARPSVVDAAAGGCVTL